MDKLKFRINPFDVLVAIIVVLATILVFVSYNNKPSLGSRTVRVEVMVPDDLTIENVFPVLSDTDSLYYSGTKYQVKQVSYRLESDDVEAGNELFITVEGLGNIDGSKPIFNGQRIFVNQKVELRGNYAVQGYVVNYYYAD